jgi:Cu(I)/Ag(I) efflux system membrane fusion protein
MNKKILIGLSSLAIIAVVVLLILHPWSATSPGTHDHQAADVYTCPMHPSVISDRPGACPVCGMALVKKTTVGENKTPLPADIGKVSISASQRITANVSTAAVSRREMSAALKAVGVVTIAEPRQATVAARFRGRVERLFVASTGTSVRKGEPLFALYSPDVISAQREYLIARSAGTAAGESATVAASRMRLSVHYGMSDEQIRKIEQSGEVTSSLIYHAPIGGIVTRKEVQEGQYVDEGMVLYQLADLSLVWGVFDVYESDIKDVSSGQAVRVSAGAYPGEVFSGRVTFVEPLLNAESRTVRVRTDLANPGARLKPNMFLEGTFLRASASVLAVPTSALLMTGKRTLVWLETEPNVFEPRDVVTGAVTEGFTEIRRGLREGEHVAVTGGFLLDSESTLSAPSKEEHRHE